MNPLRGIALKLSSIAVFVAMAGLIKAASVEVPPGEAVFFRSFFAMPVILVWLTVTGHLSDGLATQQPLAHVWRGLAGTTAMALGFSGLGLLPLPEVTAIGYAAPLLVVVLAAMFLGEKVRLVRLSAVALGMCGVMIILWPRLTTFGNSTPQQSLGAMVVLGSAFFSALTQVYVRKLVDTESTSALVFYFSLTASVLSLITVPFGWVWPSPQVAAMLVVAGLLGGIGQIFMTASYRFAEVSVIASFEYASMLLALAIGFFFFGEVPTWTMLGGASLVILAGMLIIWREHQLGLERRRQRQAGPPAS